MAITFRFHREREEKALGPQKEADRLTPFAENTAECYFRLMFDVSTFLWYFTLVFFHGIFPNRVIFQ